MRPLSESALLDGKLSLNSKDSLPKNSRPTSSDVLSDSAFDVDRRNFSNSLPRPISLIDIAVVEGIVKNKNG